MITVKVTESDGSVETFERAGWMTPDDVCSAGHYGQSVGGYWSGSFKRVAYFQKATPESTIYNIQYQQTVVEQFDAEEYARVMAAEEKRRAAQAARIGGTR